MLATITISFILLACVAVGFWLRQLLFVKTEKQNLLWTPLRPASLFAPDADVLKQIAQAELRGERLRERQKMLAWASLIHFSELPQIEIKENKNWNYALGILTDRAERDEDICALISFVLANENLAVSSNLVNRFRQIWENAPALKQTAELFQLAARSNDADLFQEILIAAEQFVKNGKMADVSRNELRELADSHYWLLSSDARISGAGFWLKHKLRNS